MPFISIIFVIALIGIDQYTKSIASNVLVDGNSVDFINGFMSFTLVHNKGAAFGVFQGARWFFIILTVFMLYALTYYYKKLDNTSINKGIKFAILLIYAGALGNFIDRLLNGVVVDFLEFTFVSFPVFNVADIYVVCGTVLFAILSLLTPRHEEVTNG